MISIIPKPLKVTCGKGAFKYNFATKIGGKFEKTKMQLVNIFAKSGVEATVVSGEGDINFVADETIASEGYFLEVEESAITIKASDEAGAFYALQTLRQLCEVDTLSGAESIEIPCCVIEDKPRFKRRAFVTTQKLDKLMAAAPNIGFNCQCSSGIHTPAANGMPMIL